MTQHEDGPYLNHILDAINDIEESVKGISKEDFLENKDMKEANIRRLEIMGEAAKNVSNEFKNNHKEIEWSDMAKTRDKIIHHYFGVNLDIVWNIIKSKLPILKPKIIKILEEI